MRPGPGPASAPCPLVRPRFPEPSSAAENRNERSVSRAWDGGSDRPLPLQDRRRLGACDRLPGLSPDVVGKTRKIRAGLVKVDEDRVELISQAGTLHDVQSGHEAQ